mgnify:FL=1
MRAVIQRVKSAAVDIVDIPSPYRSGEIGSGLLVLVAVENSDSDADAKWLASKTAALRIFEDSAGKMNLSLKDVGADALVVSQFTLYGDVRKGNRPSFNRSAHPEISVPLYEKFCEYLELELGKKIQRGVFGAVMDVSLVNDGPVTIIIDS